MKKLVEKKQGKIVIRARPEDITAQVYELATKLSNNSQATYSQRERDLLLAAIAQKVLGIAA